MNGAHRKSTGDDEADGDEEVVLASETTTPAAKKAKKSAKSAAVDTPVDDTSADVDMPDAAAAAAGTQTCNAIYS